MDLTERIAKLETQVEAIKDDVTELKNDVKEIHSRITTGNREIVEKLESIESRIGQRMKENSEVATKQHQIMESNLTAEINQIKTRVDVLERWRWMIVGGALALGYLASHLELLSRVFK